MTTLAELDLRVDARQPEAAAQSLDRLAVAGDRADASADRLAHSSGILAREARQASVAGDMLGRALGAVGFGVLAAQAVRLADSYTGMQSRLGLATGSTMELARASQELFKVAQDTRVGLEATVDLYSSLQRSTQALGVSQERLLGVTETINQALVVSGASAGAAQAALTQLGQGFASGTLRGDELNSVLEQTPRLAKAIADGMGITVGQLRALGAEGKITGETVFNALEGQADKIEDEFGRMATTVGQSFTKLQNGVLRYVGEADQAAGVSRTLAEGISYVADNIEGLARVAGVAAGVVGVTVVGAVGSYVVTSTAAAVSSIALGGAISGMSASAIAGSVAVRGLGVALSFFGGPIGLAIAAVAAGIGLVAMESMKASAESARLADEMGGTKAALDAYEEATREATTATGAAKDKALVHAEALRVEASAAITAARALREKQVALAESEAAEKAVRQNRVTATWIGAMAGAGSGFPTAALAAAIPEAEAARKVTAAKTDVEVATKKQADAEARYAQILAGSSLPTIRDLATVTGDLSKAAGEHSAAERARTAAIKAAADAMRDAEADAASYAEGLERQVFEFGKSEIQVLAGASAMAAAAAPTTEAGNRIEAVTDQLIGLKAGEQAVRDLNAAMADFQPMENPDFEGLAFESLAEELRLIDGLALSAGRGMEDAFGNAGRALGGMLVALTGYRSQLAEVDKAVHEKRLTEVAAIREVRSLQVGAYGDMARAGQAFFEEGSAGYELMGGAEKAFRIIEFGLALQAIAMKGAEAAATVAAETTMTTATLTGTAVRTPAKAAEGIAGIFAALGPFGFPVAAAAIAVMAAAGVKAFGGGGGGAIPGATDMEDRQKRQGTGSVLGDAGAKTESIVRSLELVEQHTNRDLEFSNSMVKSLRSIDSQIGAVAAALARSFGAGGALDTSSLNLGMSGNAPTLSNLGFSKSTNRTLQDQGVELLGGALSDILAGGLSGNAYQQVLEQTKKKAFGVTYSNKSKSSTTTTGLDDDFLRQSTLLIGSLRDGVLAAAGAIGVDGASAALDSFQVELGKLSFKDMDPGEIQAELEAIFGKVADDMAGAILPGLSEFQKAGEGLFETLSRVGRQYQVVDVSLSSIGMTFGAVGVASLGAREHLVSLFDGLDEFTEQTAFFAETFLTEAERLAPVQAAVTKELARLGLASVDTRDEFKALVLGLDVSTAAGADLYAALMALAPAFAKVTEESQAVSAARDALADAYDREASAAESARDKMRDLARTLHDFGNSLNPLRDATEAVSYERTKRDFLSASTSRDPETLARLPDLAEAFRAAAEATATSKLDYQRDIATIQNGIKLAESVAIGQADAAQQQLDALNASVAGILQVNASVLSVRDALAAYQGAVAAQRQAEAAAAVTAPPTTSTPAANDNATAARAPDWASYIAHYSDVAAEYLRNMASAKGRAALAELGANSIEQFGEIHWNKHGKPEGRTPYATGGIIDRPMTLGESGIGGEAGEEGILPLAKVGGKMGVHAVGDGGEAAAEVRRLNDKVDRLEAALISVAKSNSQMAKDIRRLTERGIWARGETEDDAVETVAA